MKTRTFQNRILLIQDGSEGAQEALRYVSGFSGFRRMELVLFTVFSKVIDFPLDEFRTKSDGIIDKLKEGEERRQKRIEKIMKNSNMRLLGLGEDRIVISAKVSAVQDLIIAAVNEGLEQIDQQAADALLLGQDGAPDGLGRMGGEHGLDQHSLELGHHLVERHPGVADPSHDVVEASGLWLARLQVLPAPADAVHALGHVDEREVGGESSCHLGGKGRIETSQEFVQRLLVRGLSFAPRARCDPRVFDHIE